jgi:hypothetical protein
MLSFSDCVFSSSFWHVCLPVLNVALVACATPAADWIRKSSTTGDLPVPNGGDQQTCCVALDVDKDGVMDFAVGERTKSPSFVWYKFNGQGWDRHVIDDSRLQPEAGGAVCDVDQDGDVDILFGQDSSGSHLWWWENPCPDFAHPWKRRVIKDAGGRQHHDQTVGDFDGDGRPEFVSWNQKAKQLLLFEIPENPRSSEPWSSIVVESWRGGPAMEGFPSSPVDIDLDGKVDIVGGGRWYKHQGGNQYLVNIIDDSMRFTQCAAGPLVQGGRPEVVFSPGDTNGTAKWYQWKAGRWQAQELRFVVHGHTCDVADIDGDGNLDIFIGEMGSPGAGDQAKTFIWYGDGTGNFRETVVSAGQGIHEGLLSDFDGDGDIDILMKPYHHRAPRLDVLLNP